MWCNNWAQEFVNDNLSFWKGFFMQKQMCGFFVPLETHSHFSLISSMIFLTKNIESEIEWALGKQMSPSYSMRRCYEVTT